MSKPSEQESDTVPPACADGGPHAARPDSELAHNLKTPRADGAKAQPGRAVSLSFRPLDKSAAIEKTRRNLPHWRQAGCMYFVTFRLADSLPQSLLKQWREERDRWLALNPRPWTPETAREYWRKFQGRKEKWLDAGHGSCALRDPALREVVANALRYFDGERYEMDAFVVMPNHVHALVVPREGDTARPACAESDTVPLACADGGAQERSPGIAADSDSHAYPASRTKPQPGRAVSHSLPAILHSWKSYSAHQLVKHHGLKAPVWMDENFDHTVRSEAQWEHFRNYIRENPAKAGLREGEWTHWESDTVPPACAAECGTARPGCADGGAHDQPRESQSGSDSVAPPAGRGEAQPGRAVSHSATSREGRAA